MFAWMSSHKITVFRLNGKFRWSSDYGIGKTGKKGVQLGRSLHEENQVFLGRDVKSILFIVDRHHRWVKSDFRVWMCVSVAFHQVKC